MGKAGAFSFVLHSHLPYARQAGRWPHGEEWLHEAAAETYIPLLNALNELADDGVPARLTLTLTPILIEQLADDDVRRNFLDYLDQKILAAEEDIPRFEQQIDPHMAHLAGFYRDWYGEVRRSYVERYQGDLVGAFRRLQDQGVLEIATCAATHGYLPLLDRDEFDRPPAEGRCRVLQAALRPTATQHLVARMRLPPRIHHGGRERASWGSRPCWSGTISSCSSQRRT